MNIRKIFQIIILSFLTLTALLAYAQTDSDLNMTNPAETTQSDS